MVDYLPVDVLGWDDQRTSGKIGFGEDVEIILNMVISKYIT